MTDNERELYRQAAQKSMATRKEAIEHLLNPVSTEELARAVAETDAEYASAQEMLKQERKRKDRLRQTVKLRVERIEKKLQNCAYTRKECAAISEAIIEAMFRHDAGVFNPRPPRRGRPNDYAGDLLMKDIQDALDLAAVTPATKGRKSGLVSRLWGLARGSEPDRRRIKAGREITKLKL